MIKKFAVFLLFLLCSSTVLALQYMPTNSLMEYTGSDTNYDLFNRGFETMWGDLAIFVNSPDCFMETSLSGSGKWCGYTDSNVESMTQVSGGSFGPNALRYVDGNSSLWVDCGSSLGSYCEATLFGESEDVSDSNVSFWVYGAADVFSVGYLDDSNLFHLISNDVLPDGTGELFTTTWKQVSVIVPDATSGKYRIAFKYNANGGIVAMAVDNVVVNKKVTTTYGAWSQGDLNLLNSNLNYFQPDISQLAYNRDFEVDINYTNTSNGTKYPDGWKFVISDTGTVTNSIYSIDDANKGTQSIFATMIPVAGDGSNRVSSTILMINNQIASDSVVTFSSKDTQYYAWFCNNQDDRCMYAYGYVNSSDVFYKVGNLSTNASWTDTSYSIPKGGYYRPAFKLYHFAPLINSGVTSVKIDNVRIIKNNTGTFFSSVLNLDCNSLSTCSEFTYSNFPNTFYWAVDFEPSSSCEWFIDGNSQGNMSEGNNGMYFAHINEDFPLAYKDMNLTANCSDLKYFSVTARLNNFLDFTNIPNGTAETSFTLLSRISSNSSVTQRTTCNTEFCLNYYITTNTSYYTPPSSAYIIKSNAEYFLDGLRSLEVTNYGSAYGTTAKTTTAEMIVYSKTAAGGKDVSLSYNFSYRNGVCTQTLLCNYDWGGIISYGYVDSNSVYTSVGNFVPRPDNDSTGTNGVDRGYMYGRFLFDYGWTPLTYSIPAGDYNFAVKSYGTCTSGSYYPCFYNSSFMLDDIVINEPAVNIDFNVYETATTTHLTDINMDCNVNSLDLINQNSPFSSAIPTNTIASCNFDANGYDTNTFNVIADSNKTYVIYLTRTATNTTTDANNVLNSIDHVNFTCSWSGNNCTTLYYNLNSTGWLTASYTSSTKSITVPIGYNTIEYYSTSALGDEEAIKTAYHNYDLAPDTNISGCAVGWNITNQTITLSRPNEDGLYSSTSYTINLGISQTYTAPFLISADGVNSIQYYSTRLSGLVESTKTATCSIDKTLPIVSSDASTNWYFTDTNAITLDCNDSTSGVGMILFRVDDNNSSLLNWGDWKTYEFPFTMWEEIPHKNNGKFAIQYYCTDVAGNNSIVKTDYILMEVDNPPTPISIIPSTGYFSNTVNVKCNAPSWIRTYNYYIDYNTETEGWTNFYVGTSGSTLFDLNSFAHNTKMWFRCKIGDDKNSNYFTNTTNIVVNEDTTFDSMSGETPSTPTAITVSDAPFTVNAADVDEVSFCTFKIMKNEVNVSDFNGVRLSGTLLDGIWKYSYTDINRGDVIYSNIFCADKLGNVGRISTSYFIAPPINVCGDGQCTLDEVGVCSADCGGTIVSVCGDSVCDLDEVGICLTDCNVGISVCGDGVCDNEEQCVSDCGGEVLICGDSICSVGEENNCPFDCTSDVVPICGNNVCELNESNFCPLDCNANIICGDNICSEGEYFTCASDCTVTSIIPGGGGGGGTTLVNKVFEVSYDKPSVTIYFGKNAITKFKLIVKNISSNKITLNQSVLGDASKYFIMAKSYELLPNTSTEVEYTFSVFNDINSSVGKIRLASGATIFELPLTMIYDPNADFFASITGLFLFDIQLGGLGVSLWLLVVVGLLIGVFYFKNQKVKNALFLGIVVILFIVFSSQILNILGG